jgi:hypothetical protein
MSKIDLSEVLDKEASPKGKIKKKQGLISKQSIIIFVLLFCIFAGAIVFIITKLVDLPFQANNRNFSVVVQDSVNVSETKIEQVRKSFLLILQNSFWDHSNYTDIDYSNKTIGLAVNNVLGYDMKKQKWSYQVADDGITQIVSAIGKLTLDGVKYEANIKFNIVDDSVYFYDLHLKEDIRRSRYLPATPKQKSLLIQMMYRG